MAIVSHMIFARRHGEANGYPVIVAFGDEGHTAVLAKYNEITGPEEAGKTFRAENAEVQMIDNLSISAEHFFPDPSRVESERKARALAEAIAARNEVQKSQLVLANAKEQLTLAKAAAVELTDEHKKLLAEFDKEQAAKSAQADEEAQRVQAVSDEEQERLAAEQEKAAAAAKQSADNATKAFNESLVGQGKTYTIDETTGKAVATKDDKKDDSK